MMTARAVCRQMSFKEDIMFIKRFLSRLSNEELKLIEKDILSIKGERNTELSHKIADSSLSVRSKNFLYQAGIYHWHQLTPSSLQDLRKTTKLSARILKEVKAEMKRLEYNQSHDKSEF